MIKVTMCPPGEAIGYRDDDPRLTASAKYMAETKMVQLMYNEDRKKQAALDVHKSQDELDI